MIERDKSQINYTDKKIMYHLLNKLRLKHFKALNV